VGMRLLVALSVALFVVGCGGGSKPSKPPPTPSDATIIRAWADKLRMSDVDGATAYFGVPVKVANGTPPLVLNTRPLVRAFNESLPCGARLASTTRDGPRTIATFVLTDRPGSSCGAGKGDKAATEFLIRNGRIVEWTRVPLPSDQGPVSPAV
jgi:hypothetical protein